MKQDNNLYILVIGRLKKGEFFVFDKRTYMNEYLKKYRVENKDIIAEKNRIWQQNNKEHLKNYMREYRSRKKNELQKAI